MRLQAVAMLALAVTIAAMSVAAHAGGCLSCDTTSTGLVPLTDMNGALYLGQYAGGLWPGGQNQPPPAHEMAGRARAAAIAPLDVSGAPDPDRGRIVLLSIGMSNTTQEFCSQSGQIPCDPWTFAGQAAADPAVHHATLVIANGARGGQAAPTWDDPADANYDRVLDEVLAPQGLSEAQVQAVWVKVANAGPTVSLPGAQADAWMLVEQMGDIARALRQRYPNVQIAFFSSRIYAGYTTCPLNPEPYAYESAFAVKRLMHAQVGQMMGLGIDPRAGDLDHAAGAAPLLAWGPYLWADGETPRSDGLSWACSDFQSDGTHPGPAAEEKVGTLLLEFFTTSPFAVPWFTAAGLPADVNDDGAVNVQDLVAVILQWGPCPPGEPCAADIDEDGEVDVDDLVMVITSWG